MSLYFQTPLDPDVLARIILKNEVALHFNGPRNGQGAMDFRAALSRVVCPAMVRTEPTLPQIRSERRLRSHFS